MTLIRYIITVVLLTAVLPSYGQETISPSLDDYLEMSARNNPEVRALYNQYLAALEKVPQSGSLPDPQASFGYFPIPMALVEGDQLAEIQVMQMFPWFGTLKTARNEAAEMAKAKFEMYLSAKADLFYRIKSAWYQMIKLDHEIGLANQNIELLESVERVVLVKYGASSSGNDRGDMGSTSPVKPSAAADFSSAGAGMAGMGAMQAETGQMTSGGMSGMSGTKSMGDRGTSLQDLLRIKMEILEQKAQIALLTDRRKTAVTGFNALLNRELTTDVIITDSLQTVPLPYGIKEIADTILSNNPMLAMLSYEAESYALMGQKAKKMGLPMFGAGLNYMLIQKREGNTSMMNGNNMVMPMVSFSIPVYRKKYNAMQNEARLLEESARLQSSDLKNNLNVQYRNFVQNIADAERRIVLYEEMTGLSRNAFTLMLSDFTSAGSGFEELIRMQSRILEYGLRHLEAITDYNTAVAMAEKLMNSLKY